jgi:hypothetical protein
MRKYILCLAVSLGVGLTAAVAHAQKGAAMTKHASGTFDVKITPQKDEGIGDPTIGRMSVVKQFQGDLEGTSGAQMLTGMSEAVKDSGTYVAIERIRGTLQGRNGSFAVWHAGTMNRGSQSLIVTIIPDSGTEALAGIAGTMTIEIREGKHFYGIDYSLP